LYLKMMDFERLPIVAVAYLSANQNPASCRAISLLSRVNILLPFVANAKSIYQSIRHKHDVLRGLLFQVWTLCVLKRIFLPPFGFTS